MNVNSVKDRLKNFAKETGKTLQDAFVLYGLERTLYRLSISEYAERFTLKGGIFLYVTAIAEKFEAFVSLGLANSRYKDFYDIYVLATKYDIDENMLQHAIMETFEHRTTTFEDIVAFDNDFAAD